MKNIEVKIHNGYQYGIGRAKPTIRITDNKTLEEFRIETKEIEEIIKNTIIKGRYIIEKQKRKKYRRIKLTN